MIKIYSITVIVVVGFAITSCENLQNNSGASSAISKAFCSNDCKDKNGSTLLTCKLTSPELQMRKEKIKRFL